MLNSGVEAGWEMVIFVTTLEAIEMPQVEHKTEISVAPPKIDHRFQALAGTYCFVSLPPSTSDNGRMTDSKGDTLVVGRECDTRGVTGREGEDGNGESGDEDEGDIERGCPKNEFRKELQWPPRNRLSTR